MAAGRPLGLLKQWRPVPFVDRVGKRCECPLTASQINGQGLQLADGRGPLAAAYVPIGSVPSGLIAAQGLQSLADLQGPALGGGGSHHAAPWLKP